VSVQTSTPQMRTNMPSSSRAERSDESVIQIGALVPLTRPGWIEAGQHLLAGLELAVSEVNDAGGIAGRSLELLVRDTAADPQKAVAAVDELARLGVAALAGEYHSVVARAGAVLRLANLCGIPSQCGPPSNRLGSRAECLLGIGDPYSAGLLRSTRRHCYRAQHERTRASGGVR
jgi:hypothetical protein